MKTGRPTANEDQATSPEGFWVHPHGVHTSLPIVVRSVRFIKKSQGDQVVEVTATVGEWEASTEVIRFEMTCEQAAAADIIGRKK